MGQKRILVFIMLCSMLLLVACTQENDDKDSVDRNTENNVTQVVGSEETREDEADKDPNPLNFPQFAGELDFAYVAETDSQPAVGIDPGKAYTSDGIYSRVFPDNAQGWALQFYDYVSGQTVYVCSKSNCSHGQPGCDAFFDSETYPIASIWYYEGSLYTVALDEDYLCLEKVSLDGATREKSCNLMRLYRQTETYEDGTTSTKTEYPEIQLHRGYAYLSTWYPGCSSVEMLRVKLDSEEEAEQLFFYEGEYPLLQRTQPQGRYVLFQLGEMLDASGMDLVVDLYAYDTESEGNISLLCEGASGFYTVIDNRLFYTGGDDCLHRLELDTGESKIIYENLELISGGVFFGYEGSVVYEFSTYNGMKETVTQLILDQDGNVVDTRTSEEENLVSPY